MCYVRMLGDNAVCYVKVLGGNAVCYVKVLGCVLCEDVG